jgi:hypothetical protein
VTGQQTIERISAAVEHRGSRAARRADGAYFTSDDVATWLARRAICARLLDAIDMSPTRIDELLADGADLHAELRHCIDTEPAALTGLRSTVSSLRIVDPSCGAGAFLLAAWQELICVERLLDERAGTSEGPRPTPSQLVGIDIDRDACHAANELITLAAGPGATLICADALDVDHAAGGRADVVLGNPPYVRAAPDTAPDDVSCADAGNRAAWIVERALAGCAPGARIAMVMPISAASTAAWGSFRSAWRTACRSTHTAHFDAIPSALFSDAVQRISLFEGVRADAPGAPSTPWYTTRYHRWLRHERAGLLERVRHVALVPERSAQLPVPKVGTVIERDLLERIAAMPPLGRWFRPRDGAHCDNLIQYKRRWSYFLLFADFVPPIWGADGEPRQPSELQSIAIDPRIPARAIIAICSSTLFWWWFSALTDNRNVNRGELRAFGVPDMNDRQLDILDELGAELMDALRACGEVRECTYRSVGTIRNTYYRQAATRPVLDRIDSALAPIYGMDDRELTTILEYERRFRS